MDLRVAILHGALKVILCKPICISLFHVATLPATLLMSQTAPFDDTSDVRIGACDCTAQSCEQYFVLYHQECFRCASTI